MSVLYRDVLRQIVVESLNEDCGGVGSPGIEGYDLSLGMYPSIRATCPLDAQTLSGEAVNGPFQRLLNGFGVLLGLKAVVPGAVILHPVVPVGEAPPEPVARLPWYGCSLDQLQKSHGGTVSLPWLHFHHPGIAPGPVGIPLSKLIGTLSSPCLHQ